MLPHSKSMLNVACCKTADVNEETLDTESVQKLTSAQTKTLISWCLHIPGAVGVSESVCLLPDRGALNPSQTKAVS